MAIDFTNLETKASEEIPGKWKVTEALISRDSFSNKVGDLPTNIFKHAHMHQVSIIYLVQIEDHHNQKTFLED